MNEYKRVWLITGCATGFGAVLAQSLLDRGERVVATDKDPAALDHLTPPEPADLLALGLDVTEPAQIDTAVAQALEEYGRIDILVNNAGVGLGGPFEEIDLEDIRFVMEVNAMGAMAVTHAVLPQMRRRGAGHIINISSDSGKVGFPFQNVYTASKFAIEGFAECLYHEVADFGVDVTIIEPCGAFQTDMPVSAVEQAMDRISPDSAYYPRVKLIAEEMGGGHFGDPGDVADAVIAVVEMDDPPLRRRVGPDERTGLVGLRNQMPDEDYVEFVHKITSGPAPSQLDKMGQKSGGALVMETLAAAGVRYLFGIVGGHNYEFFNACLDAGIEVIDVRHEQQAVHMADMAARLTGRPAVVAVDGAPGLVNAIPGIQVAYEAQAPLIVITAQGSLEGRDIGVMQAIDQLALVKPVTKWQRTCFETKRLPEYTATAIRYASSGRPGPVFLDMPLEVMRGKVEASEAPIPTNYLPEAAPQADPAAIAEAMQILSQAEKPLIIAGSGVWWAGAGDLLTRFVEESGIPVLTRNMARGLLPDDHELCVGFMPSGAAGADAYLVLGTRLDWTIGYGRFPLFDLDAKVIWVDIKPEAIAKTRPVDVGIVADAGMVLGQLLAALPEGGLDVDPAWVARAKGSLGAMRQNSVAGLELEQRPDDKLMHGMELVLALRDWQAKHRDALTVVDGGYSTAFAIEQMDAFGHQGVAWVGSTGHLGVGVAYAIAAKLTQPERPVLAFMGDGAFGLCGLEFDTAVRYDLPIIVVIANDEGWGETRDGQRRRWGEDRIVGTDLGFTRYDQLAESLGGYGECIDRVEELHPALDRALAAAKPAIINVHTDPEQRSGVVSGLPWIIE